MDAPDLSHRFEAESVGRALELVGERWTLLILREAFFGVQRFGQLARNLNIPRPTLSSRLRMLVNAGLLARVPYSRDPERHEYRLTDKGRDLAVTLAGLQQWGDKHLSDKPPRITRRRSDKRPVIAALVPRGADVLREDEIESVPGPGLKSS